MRIYYVGARMAASARHMLESFLGCETTGHVTIAYSHEWFPYKADQSGYPYVADPLKFAQFGEYVILLLNAPKLLVRHEQLRRAGARWEHAEYLPHVTLKNAHSPPESMPIPPFPIILKDEYYGTWEEE